MEFLVEVAQNLTWRAAADITLVALLFYQVISMLRGTRAAQVLIGMLVIFFAYLISSVLQFETLNWIISRFYSDFIIVVIVLFQDDIRRLLTRFGRGPFISGIDESEGAQIIEEVCKAARTLSHDRIGAIIVFERAIGLDRLYDRSVQLDALPNEHLLLSIFQTFSPLHDGAVIIQKNRLSCASAHLPLSKSSVFSRKLGTRHSAALGISEETDAVVLVVSEETGAMSIAHSGKLEKQANPRAVQETLTALLLPLKDSLKAVREVSHEGAAAAASDSARFSEENARLENSDERESGSGEGTIDDGLVDKKDVESYLLDDVRKLRKLREGEKYDPPVAPKAPPRDLTIGGVPVAGSEPAVSEEAGGASSSKSTSGEKK
jgi:diadenylate cyclase